MTMSEAKRITVGVLGGALGIAVLFALVLINVGKGDEPDSRSQPILAQPRLQKAEAEPPVDPTKSEPALQETKTTEEARASQTLPAERPPTPVLAEQQPARTERAATVEMPAPARPLAPDPPREPKREEPGPQAPAESSYGTTATGIPTYVGPRGGVYHYSTSAKKVYERRRR
jgi:hypothetical protein